MIINLHELDAIRNINASKTIILATGTFDLFHYEHLRYLEDAKKLGNILIVALKDDKGAALKGINRPIINQEQRIAIVDSIKYVDYSVLANYYKNVSTIHAENELQKQWLDIFEPVFRLLRPNILYYEINPKLETARERVFEKYNIEGVSRTRTAVVSTSKIIERLS